MKILTGALKGRVFLFDPKADIRPTADRVRKALFDVLRDVIEGAKVLDLFSGTGALGLEALSLSATRVVFVELDKSRAEKIRNVLSSWNLQDKGEVVCQDAVLAVKKIASTGEKFDLVFSDPPYEFGMGVRLLEVLSAAKLVNINGFVVMETGKREDFPEIIAPFKKIRDKKYGQTRVCIFKNEGL